MILEEPVRTVAPSLGVPCTTPISTSVWFLLAMAALSHARGVALLLRESGLWVRRCALTKRLVRKMAQRDPPKID